MIVEEKNLHIKINTITERWKLWKSETVFLRQKKKNFVRADDFSRVLSMVFVYLIFIHDFSVYQNMQKNVSFVFLTMKITVT